MASLPTSKELEDAANAAEDLSTQQQCGALVLQAVTCGTDTNASSPVAARSQEACKVLADAWEDCEALEDFLVDALWLRGCILTSAVGTNLKVTVDNPVELKTGGEDTIEACIDALVEIIKALIQVPDRTRFYIKLQSNLMPSLIHAAGLSTEADILKRLKMYNTAVNYRQQKYNLLQEESEGFSKVIQFLTSADHPVDEQERRFRLLQYLGTFELDPNRVMDLAIDILESKLYPNGISMDGDSDMVSRKPAKTKQGTWLLGIMKEFATDELPSLVAFKLNAANDSSESLIRTVVLLAAEGLLDLTAMIQKYSTPIESEIKGAHKILWMKEKRRIQALSRISLSGTTKEDPKLVELTESLQNSLIQLKKNPILSILMVLLQWGEWSTASVLLSSESWGYLCDLYPEKFGFALCDVAQRKLEPWYRSKVGTPDLLKPWVTEDSMKISVEGSIDQVIEAISEPLSCTMNSGCISAQPVFYCQLCRVLGAILEENHTEQTPSVSVYGFFSKFMVPSLSLFPCNPAISTELWNVLKLLPYATRYRLYEDWRGAGLEKAGLSSSPLSGKSLAVTENEMAGGKATRYALKRLSKDNIREMSRQLAKVTHSCPLVVYGTILNQIESYDNMVEVMVDAQRFTNPLGLDVLGFCILSRLSGTSGGVNRSRLKEDGANVSQWLQSLEAFAGSFYKRFPFVEFRGILAYLMRRLREGNVMELGILKTLLKVPGGYGFADYSPAASLSATQLEGRAGSVHLKRQTMSFGIVEDINVRAADRIKEVLQTDGFGVSMLILIAQARARILFEATKGTPKPIKLVGNLYDSCQVVMTILLEFLTTQDRGTAERENANNAIEKYAKELPSLQELHENFGFDAESAWMLCRPLVRHVTTNTEEGDITDRMSVFEISKSFRESCEKMLSPQSWSSLTPELFESFYMNSLHDIYCPENVYSTELSRVSKEIERLSKLGPSAASQLGVNTTKNDSAEIAKLKSVEEALAREENRQRDHIGDTLATLEEKRNALFKLDLVSRQAASTFLMECVYARSMQSPDDAMYCATFAFRLHSLETPGFGTLHYIDELISIVAGALFGLTEGEAANLAILLWETWKVVNKWRYQKGLYEEEVTAKPGSYMEVLDGEAGSREPEEVSHKDFIVLYNKWHASLGAALVGCLESSEYMHTRAGLLVLTRSVEVFPTRPRLGNKLFTVLKPLQDESGDRPDIRASANAYSTMLAKARDDGKWIEEDASVAKARAEKEKAAAEERRRKLEEQFEELQRDSEKITEEIGPRDRFERRPGRDPGSQRGMGPPVPERSSHTPATNRENGEVPGRDRSQQDLGSANGRTNERHALERTRRDVGERVGRSDEQRGLGDRWSRGEAASPADNGRGNRNAKRGRPPSPEVGDDRGNTKRARLDPENYEPRRDAGRGASPSRRTRGAPESSRSSRARRNRR